MASIRIEVKETVDSLRKDMMINWLEAIAFSFVIELVYFLTSIVIGIPLPILAIVLLVAVVAEFVRIARNNYDLRKKIAESEKK